MTTTLTPCPTEDSTNCFWDANAQGNGQGQSFFDFNGELTMLGHTTMPIESVTVIGECDSDEYVVCTDYSVEYGESTSTAPSPPAADTIALTGSTIDPLTIFTGAFLLVAGIWSLAMRNHA